MQSERNRAMRCAYGWARKGQRPMVEAWIAVAEQFAPVTPKQRQHADYLIAMSRGALPGQLDIEGRVAA